MKNAWAKYEEKMFCEIEMRMIVFKGVNVKSKVSIHRGITFDSNGWLNRARTNYKAAVFCTTYSMQFSLYDSLNTVLLFNWCTDTHYTLTPIGCSTLQCTHIKRMKSNNFIWLVIVIGFNKKYFNGKLFLQSTALIYFPNSCAILHTTYL